MMMEQICGASPPALDVIVSLLDWFFGGRDGLLCALLAFVLLDCLTGAMCAIADQKPSGGAAGKCVCRKLLIFVLVSTGHILDAQVIRADSLLRNAAILFYLSTEGVSLMAHAARLGLPIPARLKTVLEQLQP